jgi:LPS sulfotransferase NodH
MFYYHASKDDGALWRRLAEDRRIPVVHLRRWNILRTATSRKLAVLSDRWVSTQESGQTEKKQVRFEPQELRADFRSTRQYEKEFAQRFAGHPMTEIEYEDFAADPLGMCVEITKMLGLPPLSPEAEVKTKKQNPEPLDQLIENYSELAEHFANTRWACFFGESAPDRVGSPSQP